MHPLITHHFAGQYHRRSVAYRHYKTYAQKAAVTVCEQYFCKSSLSEVCHLFSGRRRMCHRFYSQRGVTATVTLSLDDLDMLC